MFTWLLAGRADKDRYGQIHGGGDSLRITAQSWASWGSMYYASDSLRSWRLEGVLCKVGGLRNHRHHHCCCCCYDHNQIFLEKGNLRLYICILKEETEKAWVWARCKEGPEERPLGGNYPRMHHQVSDVLVSKGVSIVTKPKGCESSTCHQPQHEESTERRRWGGSTEVRVTYWPR